VRRSGEGRRHRLDLVRGGLGRLGLEYRLEMGPALGYLLPRVSFTSKRSSLELGVGAALMR
jgi:hypothetical protein